MWTLVCITLALGACTTPPHSAHSLCDRISDIKTLPFKGEPVDDAAYNALNQSRAMVLPCLVEKLTDTTLMSDPRKAPTYPKVTVGDVAFFLLVEFTGVEFDAMLPASVRASYKEHGVYAYFEYVESPANRNALREKWRDWLRSREAGEKREP